MGQYGMSMSPLDSQIIALGRTRRETALEPILVKVRQLGPERELSHHRAVAMALETLGDRPPRSRWPSCCKSRPWPATPAPTSTRRSPISRPAPSDTSTRECSLRELILARALYRCGDCDGIGEKILKQYAQDLRGHYARHAMAVLHEKR